MEQLYQILFFKYLYYILSLDTYENNLLLNKVFPIVDENNMSEKEKTYRSCSKYFFLLNDINLSSLSDEELNYLKTLNDNSIFDDNLIQFLKKTYKNVLLTDEDIYYGVYNNEDFKCHANYIGLGFKYEEFGFSNEEIYDMEEIEKNDRIFLQMVNEIKLKAKENDINVDIIKYNELTEIFEKEDIISM